MAANDPIKQYNPDTAQWEGIKSGEISDGTNVVTPVTVISHMHDYVQHAGIGTTTGTAPNFVLTLNPAITAYTDMLSVRIKAHTGSITGAGSLPATLNVNGRGAIPLKSSNGGESLLFADMIYTFTYNANTGNFILQVDGSDGTPATFSGSAFGLGFFV